MASRGDDVLGRRLKEKREDDDPFRGCEDFSEEDVVVWVSCVNSGTEVPRSRPGPDPSSGHRAGIIADGLEGPLLLLLLR
ncbi:hypothetical protein MRX96_011297 [Rhipicephalus microplus]